MEEKTEHCCAVGFYDMTKAEATVVALLGLFTLVGHTYFDETLGIRYLYSAGVCIVQVHSDT